MPQQPIFVAPLLFHGRDGSPSTPCVICRSYFVKNCVPANTSVRFCCRPRPLSADADCCVEAGDFRRVSSSMPWIFYPALTVELRRSSALVRRSAEMDTPPDNAAMPPIPRRNNGDNRRDWSDQLMASVVPFLGAPQSGQQIRAITIDLRAGQLVGENRVAARGTRQASSIRSKT